MTAAAGRTLIAGELVAELSYRDGYRSPIIVLHPSGQCSDVERVDRTEIGIALTIGADSDNESYRELLTKVLELLNELADDKSKMTKDIRQRVSTLADEIEEAL
jgi:hypothetical protein